MTLYEFLLFIHVAATIIWIGAGFYGLILGTGYDRDGDAAAMERLLKDQERHATRLFIPASLVTVLMGIALVIESDAWSFDYLWITLGLLGFATSFCTGLFLLKPTGDRIGQQLEREGMTPRTLVEVEKLLVKTRVDYIVLFIVVADMVIKPTGDDVAVLIGMALIAIAGLAYILTSLRAIDERSKAAPTPA
ncbi:MAG: hypothetical protein QOE69_282 [Thermoleophilaceae bacterium]|jgi:uncharacterized membrane protein|nr:hypothetical protein [Thermoleophilaceae bacterium]